MNGRLTALFLGLLLLPLSLSLWLGLRSLEDAQSSASTQARAIWSGPIHEIRDQVAALTQSLEERLRKQSGGDPLIQTSFLLKSDVLVEPSRYRADGQQDPFWTRTATLWETKFWNHGRQEGESPASAGWREWMSGEAPSYLYWWRQGDEIHGVEVDSWALLSLLSARLPDLHWTAEERRGRLLVLHQNNGKVFSQWGDWRPENAPAVLTLALPPPWEGWELRLYLSPEALGQNGAQWTTLFVLVGVGLAGLLALGGWVLIRSVGARLKEAGQRVRFVNQVSHELKTPLTNILLYGELLESALGDRLSPRASEYLQVIRDESGRLGRLITNVLTFARRDKRDAPRARPAEWNELVESCLKPLRPGLVQRGLPLIWEAGQAAPGEWDPDWVGQIVANLVSNAEKYAAEGKVVIVATGATATRVSLTVSDRGPGIPPAERERIFVPFARLDDRLTSGAAGAGLGLGIARDLARRHGGDLTLENSAVGACFRVVLPLREAQR